MSSNGRKKGGGRGLKKGGGRAVETCKKAKEGGALPKYVQTSIAWWIQKFIFQPQCIAMVHKAHCPYIEYL